jgi:hypothetical protein
MVYYPTVGTVVGAWAGAIVIPLDWDRPWQVNSNNIYINIYLFTISSYLRIVVIIFKSLSFRCGLFLV